MQPQIALITILTDDVPRLAAFYQHALGFAVKNDSGEYVEMESAGVRFSVCTRAVMAQATGEETYNLAPQGHSFELAFPCATAGDVDAAYTGLLAKGARGVQPPATMPWGQRTAFFADPDGNIHEIFADAPEGTSNE
jgi:lactoylglutathione lyase